MTALAVNDFDPPFEIVEPSDVVTPLVLLDIEPDRLTSPLMVEVGDHESSEEFPHIYGPLNVDAVLATTILPPPHGR